MEQLGIEPGPAVGRAMAYLLDLRLDEGLLGEAEARRRLDTWWAAQREAG
jgi:poly(A) polymerase